MLLLNCESAPCCSCGKKKHVSVEDYNGYNWIFTGVLVKVVPYKDEDDGRTCFYKIITAYEGVVVGDTVVVHDKEDGGACGLQGLDIGRACLIFAFGKEKNGPPIAPEQPGFLFNFGRRILS